MAMGQVDVYAFCSCLRFGHVTLNTTSDSVILPSWRWAKDENNMWHCGKNGHFGAGMMACKIIDDYLLLLPDEADARHLYQAARNEVHYFLTTDARTILSYQSEIEDICEIKALSPQKFLAVLD